MRRGKSLLWFLAVVATFACVAAMSIHVGDDMGYLFTDSVHHNGDGHPVGSFIDILKTQADHWRTTNGRLVVHTTVMAMLSLVPLGVYRAINSLMFGLLWLLMVRLVQGNRRPPSALTCAVTWLAVWVCLPQPVLLFTTLAAYAVNYLWVSVVVLAFLLMLSRGSNRWLMMAVAFFVGMLHEGASLPVLCGLIAARLLSRSVPVAVILAFAAGTALCVFAPGNAAHAAQGAPLLFKLKALGSHLLHSVIILWLIVMAVWTIRNRRAAWTFTRQNIIMTTAVLASLGMAALTFTAPRQLMMPSIFATILLLKILPLQSITHRRVLTASCAIFTLAIIAMAWSARLHVYRKYNAFMHFYAEGHVISYAPGSDTKAWIDRTTSDLLTAYAPDPLLNRGLMLIGDRYTMQGLRRTINPSGGGVLPYDRHFILSTIDTTFTPLPVGEDMKCSDTTKITVAAQPLGPFSVTVVPLNPPLTIVDKLSPRVTFTTHTHRYYLSPPRQTTTFKKKT